MSRVFSCSACGKTMTLAEDMAGKLVRCPHCKATFTVNHEGTPVVPKTFDAPAPHVPLPSWRVREIESVPGNMILPPRLNPQWSTVRSGLNLMYLSLLIFFVATVFCVPAFICAGFDRFAAMHDRLEALFAIADLAGCGMAMALVFCGIAGLSGLLSCLATPKESAARGVLNGALLSLLVYVALTMFLALADLDAPRFGGPPRGVEGELAGLLALLKSFLPLLAGVLFILYLRKLANFFGDTALAKYCQAYLIFFVVSLVAFEGLGYFFGSFGLQGPFLQNVFNFGANPSGLWWFTLLFAATDYIVSTVWLIYLLRQCRDLIDAVYIDSRRPGRVNDY